jgi:hypothetical protein
MVDLIPIFVLMFLIPFTGTLSAIVVVMHFWVAAKAPSRKTGRRRSKKGVKSPTSENVTKVLK